MPLYIIYYMWVHCAVAAHAQVEVGLPEPQARAKKAYDQELRRRLPKEQLHIIAGDPGDTTLRHYGKAYYDKWLGGDGRGHAKL